MRFARNKNSIHFSLILTVLVGVFLLPGFAEAYFSNDAQANDSSFTAGSVDISVTDSDENSLVISGSTGDDFSLTASNVGSVSEQYQITFSPQSCNAAFWNGLYVAMDKDSNVTEGLVGDVIATSITGGVWTVDVTASGSLLAAEDETCVIDMEIIAWQQIFASTTSGGFYDSKVVSLTVTASEDIGQQPTASVVLNEIYPAILSTTTVPLEREWVELYNGTNAAIDVAGWSIGEISGTSTENHHTIVGDCTGYPASTHMQPYGTTDTTINPGGLLVVEFCGSSSYLNDGGDTVILYAATTSPAVDTHTYPSTVSGKSHARIPDGSNWVDPIPTPGTPNTATREELEEAGWSESDIDGVLGTNTNDDELVEAVQSAVGGNPAGTTTDETLEHASSTTATTTSSTSTAADPIPPATDSPASEEDQGEEKSEPSVATDEQTEDNTNESDSEEEVSEEEFNDASPEEGEEENDESENSEPAEATKEETEPLKDSPANI